MEDGKVSVRSHSGRMEGQEHRSSKNFNTEHAPDGTNHLLWNVTGGGVDDPGEIYFTVMAAEGGGFDTTLWEHVKDGKTTKYRGLPHVYIADPHKAKEMFTVTATAVTS